ncbi:integral membrane protein yggT [Vibrio ishigakensis]|nr:integral membrane protein yggT [Vibrio ishigakensis]GAM64477.1 integral membrane protein yggT [Vibrio ishigakensis]
MLAPIRRFIPAMGGLDLSVLVLFIILQFANFLIGDLTSSLFGPIWYSL